MVANVSPIIKNDNQIIERANRAFKINKTVLPLLSEITNQRLTNIDERDIATRTQIIMDAARDMARAQSRVVFRDDPNNPYFARQSYYDALIDELNKERPNPKGYFGKTYDKYNTANKAANNAVPAVENDGTLGTMSLKDIFFAKLKLSSIIIIVLIVLLAWVAVVTLIKSPITNTAGRGLRESFTLGRKDFGLKAAKVSAKPALKPVPKVTAPKPV